MVFVTLVTANTVWFTLFRSTFAANFSQESSWLATAVLGVFSVIVCIGMLSRFDERSTHFLRLDWFLPALRKTNSTPSASPTLLGQLVRRCLPRSFQSNRHTKQRGSFRKRIRSLGISWLASPPRRVVQSIALAIFLLSFFWVCWPYDARPAGPPRTLQNCQLSSFQQDTGQLTLKLPHTPSTWLRTGESLTIAPQGAPNSLSEFRVLNIAVDSVQLIPHSPIHDDLLDEVLLEKNPSVVVYERSPNAWPSHYADNLARKEWLPAEFFLAIDPLVSLSTAIASGSWVWSLLSASIILIVCLLIPRGFCGYLCPLGTTIDLFDWLIGKRVNRFRVPDDGWWVHIKYYLLAGNT